MKLFTFLRDLQVKGAELNYKEPSAEFYEDNYNLNQKGSLSNRAKYLPI